MLKNFRISEGKIVESDGANGDIHVYVRPTEEEKRFLVDEFKLDEHTLNSALDPDELPRLEFEPNHMALIYKRPRSYSEKDNFLFKVYSIGVFLFSDRIIIIEADETPLFDGKLFLKINSVQEIVIKLMYKSIFRFMDNLKRINSESGLLEQQINTSMRNEYLISMFTLEKSLVYYQNAINSNSVVIEKLRLNSAKIGFTDETVELLEDLIIENNQCYRQAEIYSNILASMMDARVSIVSNNLNILIKNLTIITIGIMVPTFVVSAFSMNVKIPFPHESPASFYWIMIIAALSLAALGFVMKSKKW